MQLELKFEGDDPECTADTTCVVQSYHWYESTGVGTPVQLSVVTDAVNFPDVVEPPVMDTSVEVAGAADCVIGSAAVNAL